MDPTDQPPAPGTSVTVIQTPNKGWMGFSPILDVAVTRNITAGLKFKPYHSILLIKLWGMFHNPENKLIHMCMKCITWSIQTFQDNERMEMFHLISHITVLKIRGEDLQQSLNLREMSKLQHFTKKLFAQLERGKQTTTENNSIHFPHMKKWEEIVWNEKLVIWHSCINHDSSKISYTKEALHHAGPGFSPRELTVAFLVDKVALRLSSAFPAHCNCNPTTPPYWYQAAVPKDSVLHHSCH